MGGVIARIFVAGGAALCCGCIWYYHGSHPVWAQASHFLRCYVLEVLAYPFVTFTVLSLLFLLAVALDHAVGFPQRLDFFGLALAGRRLLLKEQGFFDSSNLQNGGRAAPKTAAELAASVDQAFLVALKLCLLNSVTVLAYALLLLAREKYMLHSCFFTALAAGLCMINSELVTIPAFDLVILRSGKAGLREEFRQRPAPADRAAQERLRRLQERQAFRDPKRYPLNHAAKPWNVTKKNMYFLMFMLACGALLQVAGRAASHLMARCHAAFINNSPVPAP